MLPADLMVNASAGGHNPVLSQLLDTGRIPIPGGGAVSLHHPEFPAALSHVDRATGELLQRLVRQLRPRRSLEIGLAYGMSTLFICEALAEVSTDATHVVVDPFQHGKWRGLGLANLARAGLLHLVDFRDQPSELVLPHLLSRGEYFDFVFVDGLHRFDQVMMEFYYVNRLLRPGGVVAFDDADRRSVSRAIRHALTYPCYTIVATSERAAPPISLLGRVRRQLASLPAAHRIVRRDVLVRDWDLGLGARCVALEKTADDTRHTYFDVEF